MYCLTPTIIVTTSSLRSSSEKVVPASFSSSKISKNTFSFFSPVMKDFIFRAKKVVWLNKLYFSVYLSFSFTDLVLGANDFSTITNNCQLKLFLSNFLNSFGTTSVSRFASKCKRVVSSECKSVNTSVKSGPLGTCTLVIILCIGQQSPSI